MARDQKESIVVVYDRKSTAVQRDIDVLTSQYRVLELQLDIRSKWMLPIMLTFFLISLFKMLLTVKKIFIWGGGYHSFVATFLAKILGRKGYIIAIGTDCIRLPEINYGHFCHFPLNLFTASSFRLANKIFPVHHSLIYTEYRLEDVKYTRQGIKGYIPNLTTEIIEIKNGYDSVFWKDIQLGRSRDSFLTVAIHVTTQKRMKVKGIDVFLKVAELFPQYRFTLVGEMAEGLEIPDNVIVLGEKNSKELRAIYSSHQYYLQLSRSEGFPNALCEAMLCGCVPIATAVASQPEIIGDTGFLLRSMNDQSIVETIQEAIADNKSGSKARNRIVKAYPLEKRKRELLDHLATS